jgi:hypothetical protein
MTTYDIVRDTYTRTVTDDWGRADNGTDWEILAAAAADFDVVGGRGTIIHPSAAVTHQITVPGKFKNVIGYYIIRTSAVSTGASAVADVLMRYVDASNYVAARVEFNTASDAVAVLYKVVAGAVTTLQTVTVDPYTFDYDFEFKYEIVDDVVRCKLWQRPFDEPSNWVASGSVSNITAPGRLILQTRRETGNTNANLILSFDEFYITSTIPTVSVLPQFLNDYEFKFGQDENAIILNAGAGSIIPGEPLWDVQKVSGLDLPDVKISDKEFDGIDGGVVEAVNISMRTVVLEGILYAHQDDSLESYLDDLKTNFAPVPRESNGAFFDPSQKPFFIKAPGVAERFLLAKSVGLKYDWDMARRFNSTTFQIILKAQIPTLFSPQLHLVTANLTAAVEQRLSIYNAGNYHSYALIRLYQIGNTPTVYLRHLEQAADLDLSLGIPTSLANRPVEINMRQRTVFAVDTPPENHRDDVQTEGWWRLQPGMNTIAVTTSVSNSGYVELLWRDEWF